MFGAVPGLFKNFDACKTVCRGYQEEEGNPWVVVQKFLPPNMMYRACPANSLQYAKDQGYSVADNERNVWK